MTASSKRKPGTVISIKIQNTVNNWKGKEKENNNIFVTQILLEKKERKKKKIT